MDKKIKYLLIFLAFILLIFIISIVNKLSTIETLKDLFKEYLSSDNHYVKITNYHSNTGTAINTEIYEKSNVQLIRRTFFNGEKTCELITYHNGDKTNSYLYNGAKKIAKLNLDESKYFAINDIYPKSFFQDLKMAIFSSVSSGEYKGKQCYIITYNNDSSLLKKVMFVEKETGLLIRSVEQTATENGEKYDIITSYEYKFDTVKDEDIKEPNINDYIIEQQ